MGVQRTKTDRLYDAAQVSTLFDQMASTYGVMNYVTSFGFCARWRRVCVEAARLTPGADVYDLMSGMGECWHLIGRALQGQGSIRAVDFSAGMNRRARERAHDLAPLPIVVRQENFLANEIDRGAADAVVSAFGLKTFSAAQTAEAARQLRRILKPGGRFSLLEISLPNFRMLRWPYLFYLKRMIPLLGRLFLGNPDNYRLLGLYTESFDPDTVARELEAAGLSCSRHPLFFGCATLFVGTCPA